MDRHAQHFPVRYMLNPQSRSERVGYHLGFWVVFILFHLLYFAGSEEKIYFETSWVISYAVFYLRFVPVYYLTVAIFGYLKERYFGKSLIVLTGVSMVLLMHAANVGVFFLLDQFYGLAVLSPSFDHFGHMYLRPPGENKFDDWSMLLIYDVTEMQLLFLPVGLKMMQFGFREQLEKKDLLTEKLKNDLATLQSQPAPHFILNTLNSVQAELLPVSEKAAEYVVKLTEIYRFTLYEASAEMIDLQREWDVLLRFTELEADRFQHRLKLTVRQNGQIPKSAQIPTLILFTLMENAFKHGVYSTIEDCWVYIELNVTADKLSFKISNSKPVQYFNADNPNNSGIGLNNVQQRLELSVKNEYTIKQQDDEQQYSIELSLPLRSEQSPG
ncbi:hypothetical protein DSL64_21570 [Dyadobacter luteus]|uniref:Signal transduction histidine kinase internal region domain-containing protein n=1 Tax=Dyadobacter luteus TaxID=2259619 RepID=A0A3D8Y616_9BACT|nr:histidine kinase [Dyadobacter luteus]REA58200.1 hypothetical protein DSL64_21570 [Dyadobacter luteus]